MSATIVINVDIPPVEECHEHEHHRQHEGFAHVYCHGLKHCGGHEDCPGAGSLYQTNEEGPAPSGDDRG